jgi:hypothetical protein
MRGVALVVLLLAACGPFPDLPPLSATAPTTSPGLSAIGPDGTPPSAFQIVDPRVEGLDRTCAGQSAQQICLVGGLTP